MLINFKLMKFIIKITVYIYTKLGYSITIKRCKSGNPRDIFEIYTDGKVGV